MKEPQPSAGTLDNERILGQAQALAFPRYPGTDGDRKAIALVGDWLRGTGLEVSEEEFSYDLRPAQRALQAVLVGCGLLVGIAGWVALRSPLTAGVMVAGAALVVGTFLGWAPWIEKIYHRQGPTHTANVVGRRSVPDPRLTLIFMAHHDSKSQNLTLPWRLGLTLLALGGTLVLMAQLFFSIFARVGAGTGTAPEIGPPWLLPVCGGVAAVALLVLSTIRNGNRSPGAIDNAGSVGIVVELARTLPSQMPADVELIFLSPGAEEDHMIGAMRWLDRHRQELQGRPVYTLNFDGAGNPGRLVVLDRYGFGQRFSPVLSRVTQRAAKALGEKVWSIVTPPAMGVDAIPFAHRGFASITFSSGSLGRGTVGIHSSRDLPEHLHGPTLGRVARLGAAVAQELAVGQLG